MQDEMDRRFASMQLQMDQRFAASDKAVASALTAADLATSKAETAAEKRFDSVNEFRQTLSDQTKSFVTLDKFEGVASRVDRIESAALTIQQSFSNRTSTRGVDDNAAFYRQQSVRTAVSIAIAAVASVIAIAAVVVSILHR
jgi:anti-sigma-K factor RskA